MEEKQWKCVLVKKKIKQGGKNVEVSAKKIKQKHTTLIQRH